MKEVSVNLGATLNIGNYQSIRVDVGATAAVDNKTPDEAFDEARAFAAEKLNQELKKLKAKFTG